MSVRLHHPDTGGTFMAAESAVAQWQRAGWVTAEQLAAGQQADKPSNGTAASSKAAGKAEVAAKPNEE